MRFWGIYDTWTEYDILAAMTKYQVQRDTKVIGRDGVGGAYIETAVTPEDCIRQFAASILKDNPQGARIETNELMQQLRAQGIPGNARTIHGLLEAGGFLPDGDTYILPAM